jgi:hypothetical protein
LKLWTVSVSTWKVDLYRRLWLGRGEAAEFPPGSPSRRCPTSRRAIVSQSAATCSSGTTLQWAPTSKTWQAGAVMQESDLNRRQTVRFGPEVAFAQIGIIGFDGQIELEALRLYGLPEDAPAILSGCPALPAGGRTLMMASGISWDLPNLGPGAVANADVTVPGARRGDFADASLDTSSIAFVLDGHVWSNDKVRVTARNVSLSTVDLPAAGLSVQVVKRKVG